MSFFSDVERDLVVAARTVVADGVVALDLVAHNGRDLPAWAPGAHVDLVLADGRAPGTERVERQYSLCGDLADRSTWRVAVLREDGGRGGSVRVHHEVREGQRLRVRGPRNHFTCQLLPGAAYRFLAGGIGITAVLPMARAATAAGVDWTLDYAGRSISTMAFADDALALDDGTGRVRLHPADQGARLDVAALVKGAVDHGAGVYACGPARLLTALEEAFTAEGRPESLHVERFEAVEYGEPVWAEPFEVELATTGDVVVVSPGQSVLEAIEEQSPAAVVLSSCRRGTCGMCEVPVLEGEIEHRDSVLTPVEREESAVMMACVSRAAGPRIVLDV
ncbi:Ferredoxin-NADP reductase [Quadrisphaera granulorum]|uniref:Ferredoxin-NADP reductase n=1 Tax=Quadrisphaera granulorum TaxID=317664 RepID=A0A316AAW4_9ACTN|nr:PDR/VanB family oxidoreductase [Quadrisphaera granulorum]PWJ53994.1 ferredoxin-NADP reductase [Quadrisphaera granulorum]SZE96451.1 Ferredoxin-NADP reductase [Quadrisphaera granulorum]